MCCKNGRKGKWINSRFEEELQGYDSAMSIDKLFYSDGYSKPEGV
jgi:hypothetical protein